MREDYLVVKQIALCVEAGNLATVPESRVDGHRPLLAHRRGQKELLEILAEDIDRLNIGLRLELGYDFI